jgi:cell division protein FtsZ
VLFNVTGGEDLGILEIYDAAEIVSKAVDQEANIKFGAVIDPNFPAGQVKITLIATGFDTNPRPADKRRNYGGMTLPQQAPAQQQPQPQPVPAAQPTSQQPARPSVRPQPQQPPSVLSGDDLDIPPFLRNRNRPK